LTAKGPSVTALSPQRQGGLTEIVEGLNDQRDLLGERVLGAHELEGVSERVRPSKERSIELWITTSSVSARWGLGRGLTHRRRCEMNSAMESGTSVSPCALYRTPVSQIIEDESHGAHLDKLEDPGVILLRYEFPAQNSIFL
jgi:hypothetical protein